MKKNNNRGYMLAETLIVTAFVAGVLIYLFVQLSNLSNSYERDHNYNTVPGLYALTDVAYLINKDDSVLALINNNYIELDCTTHFSSAYRSLCSDLITAENIDTLLVAPNHIETISFSSLDNSKFEEFINHIVPGGLEDYRLIAKFNDDTYATLRFGG